MGRDDLDLFRKRCGQFRWLAVFMVVSIGAVMALTWIGGPIVHLFREGESLPFQRIVGPVVWFSPVIFYLFGVWTIGSAMGQLARGRLIQPTLSSALRRVGLALGFGGVMSVFVVPNLLLWIDFGPGSILNFDVGGMTLGMIGGALYLLGRVMDQAGRLQAELDEMI